MMAVTVAVGSGSGRVRVVVARFPRCHLAISSSLRLAVCAGPTAVPHEAAGVGVGLHEGGLAPPVVNA